MDDGSDDDASGDDLLADTSDVESEYNSEEMAELSRMFTQMMNEAGEEDIMSMLSQSDGDDEAAPEVFGPTRPPGMKPNEKDKSGKKPKSKNPFVKLVKQFAGMFGYIHGPGPRAHAFEQADFSLSMKLSTQSNPADPILAL